MFDTSHFHPMLVHFPIALSMVGLLLEIIRFLFYKTESKLPCGELLLYLATISAVFALLAGFLFTATLSGKPLEVRNLHMLLGILATIALLLTSIFYLIARFRKENKKMFHMVGLLLYLLSAALSGATGFLGGKLVYTYLIGL